MYLKYYIIAFVKVVALLALAPYLFGVLSGFFQKENAKKYALIASFSYIAIIEIWVLIDKGAPFLFANLYYMFSLSPITWVRYSIGVAGLGGWVLLAMSQTNKGRNLVLRFMKDPQKS